MANKTSIIGSKTSNLRRITQAIDLPSCHKSLMALHASISLKLAFHNLILTLKLTRKLSAKCSKLIVTYSILCQSKTINLRNRCSKNRKQPRRKALSNVVTARTLSPTKNYSFVAIDVACNLINTTNLV